MKPPESFHVEARRGTHEFARASLSSSSLVRSVSRWPRDLSHRFRARLRAHPSHMAIREHGRSRTSRARWCLLCAGRTVSLPDPMAPHDMLDGVDVCDSQDDHGPCIDLLFDSSDDPMFEGVVPFVGGAGLPKIFMAKEEPISSDDELDSIIVPMSEETPLDLAECKRGCASRSPRARSLTRRRAARARAVRARARAEPALRREPFRAPRAGPDVPPPRVTGRARDARALAASGPDTSARTPQRSAANASRASMRSGCGACGRSA